MSGLQSPRATIQLSDTAELQARLLTVGEAPGYRDAFLLLDVTNPQGVKQRVQLCLNAEDTAALIEELTRIHRFAWRDDNGGRGAPIDIKPGERRPGWI